MTFSATQLAMCILLNCPEISLFAGFKANQSSINPVNLQNSEILSQSETRHKRFAEFTESRP